MHRYLFVLLLLFFDGPLVYAQKQFAADDIPAELKANANSVIRDLKNTLEINGDNQYTFKRELTITLLNDRAEDEAVLRIHYDKETKFRSFEGAIYDKSGNIIKKLKEKDLDDMSNTSGSSLFDDNRMKAYRPIISSYPITVSYTWEVVTSNTFFTYTFYPYISYNQGVESAQFNVIAPESFEVNIHNLRAGQPETTTAKGRKSRKWTFTRLSAIAVEPFSLPVYEIIPAVIVAPKHFIYNAYKGSNTSWEAFGQWIYALTEGRQTLPDATVNQLKTLTAKTTSEIEKARLVYAFMQSKTRYVSIQLGIGGYQPFDAETVDRLGYGDCKALTNYTHALMEAVGVPAYYALVNSGYGKYSLFDDFPSNQFNHVILCLPMKGDTVWLECTNQQIPFGFIGRFTNNRKALLISKEGGKLVCTTRYGKAENVIRQVSEVHIDGDGNAVSTIRLAFSGLLYDDYYDLGLLSTSDLKRRLYKEFDFANFDIVSQAVTNNLQIPEFVLQLEVKLPAYVSRTGQVNVMPLSLTSNYNAKKQKARNRKQDFELLNAYCYQDTIHYLLPENTIIKTQSQHNSFESPFGSYSSQLIVDGSSVTIIRKLETNQGRFPAEAYEKFIAFYDKVAMADKLQLIY
ncbi:MAG: transglutaminase family protein [Bacteroidetes bacterium]|nr:transglutaminase family protein [Bacteroidota bacterium]